jgi:hypothetical protein
VFAAAYKLAREFTKPVVISRKTFDGKISASIGSFIMINSDGWILTAWHIIELLNKLEKGQVEHREWQTKEAAIRAENHSRKELSRRLQAIGHPTRDSVQNSSVWWGYDGARCVDVTGIPNADLAIGRLKGFDPKSINVYPVFKDPTKNIDEGTSLCRLGFPFQSPTRNPTYDETRNAFVLPPGMVPPLFPIEGILTRLVHVGKHDTHGYDLSFIETSSPGLLGQSGGPLFDQKGTVWGVQSRTIHIPLGFSPPVQGGKKGQVEHQFLNLGWGVHPATVLGHMKERGVAFALSDY